MKNFLIHLLLLFPLSFLGAPIHLSEIKNFEYLHEYDYYFYEDTDADKDFEDLQLSDFTKVSGVKKVEEVNSNYWLAFQLHFDVNQKWLLELISPHTEYVTLYYPIKNGGYDSIVTGHKLDFKSRAYHHKNFVFDVDPNWDFERKIFLKIRSDNKVAFLLKIVNQKYFTAYSLSEYILLGVFYGVLLLLIFYNALMFLNLKRRVYLFYSIMVFFAALSSLSDDGLGFKYIWTAFPGCNQILGLYVIPFGFLIFYSLYAYSFLPPIKHKKWILYGSAIYLFYRLIVVLLSAHKIYFDLLYLLPFILIYLFYLRVYFVEKYKPALFFIIGNSFALIGVLINQLRLLEVIPGNVFTVYAFNVGVLMEFITLSLSIAYQYKSEIKERILAQDKQLKTQSLLLEAEAEKVKAERAQKEVTEKINEQLDLKVQERTKDLSLKNQQLNDLIGKLSQLNLEYDKENWDLKSKFKEEKKQMVLNETLSYKEFKALYPTKFLCLEYLAKEKWKNGFSCKNCSYDKYSEKADNLERKCSRCGKIHSVTESTLFHRQKTPLYKLFYITYLIHKEGKIDVANLSEKIQVSSNSIYAFIKKVNAIKNSKNSKNWLKWVFGN